MADCATSAPHSAGSPSTTALNDWRFSPFSIASIDAPISSTPYLLEDAFLGELRWPC